MLNIIRSKRFNKDLQIAIKRGFDMDLLDSVISKLANGKTLEKRYRDHALLGNYEDFRECHIKPDWILIYRIDDEDLELFLFRTGTHSDLF